MFNLFLTQGGGFLGIFEKPIGWIINWIYEFLSSFGIESVALSIIFLTLIVKTLMLPLTIRQQKFTKLSSVMNPEIMEVQSKYKDKKDEVSMQKQQNELQAVYDKYGTNPSSGCLPMLITLPIMMGLYRVIYKIPAYIQPIKDLYLNIATSLKPVEDIASKLVEYGEKSGVKISDFTEFASDGILTDNHIVDILSKFNAERWSEVIAELNSLNYESIAVTIQTYVSKIFEVNSLPGGVNLLESPGLGFPGILIPILATALQFVQTKQIAPQNNNKSQDSTAATMNSMNKVMPLMSGVMCVMLPTGVGLYWVSNSLFTIIQQFFINKYMKSADIDKMIEKNVEKNKEKQKEKDKNIGINKGRSFEDIAKTSTRKIDNNNIYKTKDSDSSSEQVDSQVEDKNMDDKDTLYRAGSIGDYANILRNRDSGKGDK